MSIAGYSGTPLAKKLGYKKDQIVRLIHQPANYFELLKGIPLEFQLENDTKIHKDVIHVFLKDVEMLKETLVTLRNEIKQNGMIWVSWPKKSSKVKTDITEDVIRNTALQIGLVDVKVCAVDETWSALKLVIPVKNRK